MLTAHYLASRFGQLHYVECGSGEPILLLHQTPRSWTEYAHVLPLLGARHRAIAMDTVGYGASAKPADDQSIEMFADGVEDLIDGLGLESVHLVGHHTGGVIAIEVAARLRDRVRSLVLSATPFVTPETRARAPWKRPIDWVQPKPDGSHLVELWNRRRHFYQTGQDAALTAFVADALRVLERAEDGHIAIRAFLMEQRLPLITAPATVICGQQDDPSMPSVEPLAAALSAKVHVVPDAGVPFPEQRPDEFARLVLEAVDHSMK
ncbi:alpha/beta fold hydrolase [Nocardia sp. CA2R105]|uniref:alpha/beta fold hydrolase n=1 Tax=Nocardia coffeae TaxID=2873381 RepID=UPI001CA6CA0A|nr:alpha/beta fold hydrolase [Nocardia coffeae]MBY8856786.1 alpha/beta fold hydrolase [Nocardia coffeae]